jgi:DNA (cytosine-5)-methyltransferase 1
VFVVGYLGDWRVAAAVLFERESLQRDIKPSRKKRQEVAPNAEGSVGAAVFAGNQQSEVAATLQTTCDDYSRADGFNVIIDRVAQPIPIHDQATRFNGKRGDKQDGKGNGLGVGQEYDPCPTLTKGDRHAVAQPIALDERNIHLWSKENLKTTPSLTATDYKGAKSVAQPIAVDTYNQTINEHTTQTIRSQSGTEHIGAVLQAMAFDWQCGGDMRGMNLQDNPQLQACQTPAVLQTMAAQPIVLEDQGGSIMNVSDNGIVGTLRAQTHGHEPALTHGMAIRRLTPKECERLQGFPDDWTQIPYRNKPADQCPDGPRYKACGNSMAVPVMRWIGQRIQLIDTIIN